MTSISRLTDVGRPWHDRMVPASMSSPQMVGREGDLERLRGLLEAVADGVPRTAVVGGEAGIGKTRLLAEFIESVPPEALVLRGQSVDLGTVAAPYAPVKDVLRSLVAEVGAE